MSEPKLVKTGHEMKCGHSEPDLDRFSWQAFYPLNPDKFVLVQLKNPSSVKVLQDHSNFLNNSAFHPFIQRFNYWNKDSKFTMVQDEGFEVRIRGNKFFGFNKFEPLGRHVNSANLTVKTSDSGVDQVTNCDETVTGWQHNEDLSQWGCQKGYKVNDVPTLDSLKQQMINANDLLNQKQDDNADNINNKINRNTDVDNNKINNNIKIQNNSIDTNKVKDDELFDLSFKEDNDPDKNEFNKLFNDITSEEKNSQPLNSNNTNLNDDDSTSFLDLNTNFREHTKVVERLHSPNVRNQEMWEGKSISDLNRLAGSTSVDRSELTPLRKDVSDLPRSFNKWAEEGQVPDAVQQGNCGACQAISTVHMIEARLRIKQASFQNDKTALSFQHPLDCAYYNQGCDGGYPFLVSKFASEFEIVSAKCSPQRGHNWNCNTCNVQEEEFIQKVQDQGQVGGYQGATNEREMMLEIMTNGPIACSQEPPQDLFLYSSGVYKGEAKAEWRKAGLPRPEWTKVDHSNLCVGWGQTEDGVKQWIIQNTWGKEWGLNGQVWFKRGEDVAGVESIAVFADPVILRKSASGGWVKVEPDQGMK